MSSHRGSNHGEASGIRPLVLLERVRTRLAAEGVAGGAGGSHLTTAELGELARRESALVLDSVVLDELSTDLSAAMCGAGPLEELLALPGITDVLVNAPDEVWLDRGAGLERASVRFPSDVAIRVLAVRLAAQAGRRLDDAAPFVDASLPDGTRLHAVLPPLVAHPAMSLRVLNRRRLSMADLIEAAMMSAELAELLTAVIGARLTLLISGGTGAGKTTLLAALLSTVPSAERVVTIEDAPELAVQHPHVVALLARSANVEGAGAVDLRELVRQALRMRADRLVVGEFRGAEIAELLAALNTGHSGGAATVHANSLADVPSRLVALAALGGMSADVLAAQASSGLDVVAQVGRDQSGRRRVREVGLWPRSGALAAPAVVWTRQHGLGPAASALAARIRAAGAPTPGMLTAL
ncbi:TadA family conjugal transfer-associated ATPase [Jatrophihabitans sp. DSM 45814]